MDDSFTAPVLPTSTLPTLSSQVPEPNVEPLLFPKEEEQVSNENKTVNTEPTKLASSQNPDYIDLIDDDDDDDYEEDKAEEKAEEKDEMIIELPHPDALESLYPRTMTEIDLHWSATLIQKPTIIIEEAAKPYNPASSDDEELQTEQIKVYLKRKGMTRGRNYPLSELRGGTQHLLGLYRRHYNQAMRILSMIKEEIDRVNDSK